MKVEDKFHCRSIKRNAETTSLVFYVPLVLMGFLTLILRNGKVFNSVNTENSKESEF